MKRWQYDTHPYTSQTAWFHYAEDGAPLTMEAPRFCITSFGKEPSEVFELVLCALRMYGSLGKGDVHEDACAD